MKKVIITGATGMIGIHLINYFINNGISVLAIIRENSRKKNLIPKSDKVKIIECNLNNLKELQINEKFEAFIHLAWDGTFGEERNNLYTQIKNIEYTLDAVNLASRLGCQIFLGAGSQAEYGRVDNIMTTDDTLTKPENGYGIAKLCAGQMSRFLANKLNIKHIWIRIVSLYGIHDGEETMVSNSINEMMKGNSPEYTKGEQTWDYLNVEDAVKAISLLLDKGKDGEIYLVASGKSKLLKEYIEIIKNVVNKDIKLKLGSLPYRENQVMNLKVDISKLQKDTGFNPEIDFEEGIRKILEYKKR